MSTKISWADATWSPIVGCSKISAGCVNCSAEKRALRLAAIECYKPYMEPKYLNVVTADKATRGWTGQTHFVESALTKPLHWRKPRKIFVNSMSDSFHLSVPFEWLDRIFAIPALCPQHQFMFLTKRAGRMREYIYSVRHEPRINRQIIAMDEKYTAAMVKWPLPNVHLGVTVENSKEGWRLTELRKTPAAHKFVSLEPWLGNCVFADGALDFLDYAYIGCESGPGARLCSLDEIRYLMQQCWEAGVKIHVNQIPLNGKCSKKFNEWPKEFQVREI